MDTNALYVDLPRGARPNSIATALARFGEIWHFEAISLQTAFVAYFDVRASSLAAATLGPGRCMAAQQYGDRVVRMAGQAESDLAVISGVSNTWSDPNDDGVFWVEFYDVRDAWHTIEQADYPVEPEIMPVHLKADCVADAACPETHTGVLLGDLPNAICSDSVMKAVLQQAQVGTAVVSCQVWKGSEKGRALVKFDNPHSAQICVSHFNGRQWGSCIPVSACLTEADSSLDADNTPMRITPSPLLAKAPRRDNASFPEAEFSRVPRPMVDGDVDDNASEEDAQRPPGLSTFKVSPPPGLPVPGLASEASWKTVDAKSAWFHRLESVNAESSTDTGASESEGEHEAFERCSNLVRAV